MKKFKCKESFVIYACNEDGFFTDEYMEIEKDTVWELQDGLYTITGADLRLECEESWIEICAERLNECFEEIEEGESE